MHQRTAEIGKNVRRQMRKGLFRAFQFNSCIGAVNRRIHKIRLPARFDLLPNRRVCVMLVSFLHQIRLNRLSAGRQRAHDRHIQIAEYRQRKRLGNRRCAHHQKVRLKRNAASFLCAPPLVDNRLPLDNAEAVLLIDNGEL